MVAIKPHILSEIAKPSQEPVVRFGVSESNVINDTLPRCLRDPETELFLKFVSTRDNQVLEQLIKIYEGPLLNCIQRITKNRELAEDVMIHTWQKICDKANDFNPEQKFSRFLYTVATNTALDSLRREKKFRNTFSLNSKVGNNQDETAPEYQSQIASKTNMDPAFLAECREESKRIKDGIQLLAQRDRDYIEKHFFKGVRFKDIDDTVPLGTVKSRMHNALCKLKRKIEGNPEKTVIEKLEVSRKIADLSLTDLERILLNHTLVNDRTFVEVAKDIGKPISTARHLILKAQEKFNRLTEGK